MSVRPREITALSLDGFSWNLIIEIFRKSAQKIQALLKSDRNNGYFTRIPSNIYENISRGSSYNEKYFGQTL